MVSFDELQPGQSFLLAESFPGLGQVTAEVVFLRSKGPALLLKVVFSTDKTVISPGACIVRLTGGFRRWKLFPLALGGHDPLQAMGA